MAVISLIVTQSASETVVGIPDTITISTNIPTVIFYTLDGTEPNTNSSVYFAPIHLPIHLPSVTLTVLASDGASISSIFSQTYNADLSSITNITQGARFPQAVLSDIGDATSNSYYPFGTNNFQENVTFTGIGNSNNTVFNESLPSVSNGYDADGNPAVFSNEKINPLDIPIEPENRNVTFLGYSNPSNDIPDFSSNNNKLFNPKALVIYHDADNNDPLVPQIINRSAFSLENPATTDDGTHLSASPMSTKTISGSFVSRHYNPKTGKLVSYYRDSAVNRWIISEAAYSPTNTTNNFSNIVFGREEGSRHVYPWHLWFKRTLP